MNEMTYVWMIYLAIGAGIIVVLSALETERGKRREARRKGALVSELTKQEPAHNSGTPIPHDRFKDVVRGYDSPQLFREDALVRIQVLAIASKRADGWLSTSLALSVFCPCIRNNKPQELPIKAALGAWFCWAWTAVSGSSHERFLNGIQEVEVSIPFGSTKLHSVKNSPLREVLPSAGDPIAANGNL